MGTIYEDIDAAAATIAEELVAHGYALDFTLGSLAEVDRFFDEHSALDPSETDSLLASRLGQWMFALGAYSGEVLRRAIGGRWRWEGLDDDKAASTDTELVLVDGSIVWPFQRAWKRLMNGSEDSMAAWGAQMVAAVERRP
ncbi:MAG TPA: hypothetical protein VMT43_07315 [Acidimicrobiales bacterium]|nr:hypothetical protein [Acidimicrobiales bacterium]